MVSTVPLSSHGSSIKLFVRCTSAQARGHDRIVRGDFPDNAHRNNADAIDVCSTNQIATTFHTKLVPRLLLCNCAF